MPIVDSPHWITNTGSARSGGCIMDIHGYSNRDVEITVSPEGDIRAILRADARTDYDRILRLSLRSKIRILQLFCDLRLITHHTFAEKILETESGTYS